MKPSLLVLCPIFEEVLQQLQQSFDVVSNQEGKSFSLEALQQALQGKAAVLCDPATRINAEVLAPLSDLRMVSNMAVGYNNLDLPALQAKGIVASNTPDVLTETTADLTFALVLAAARRLGESERVIRAGEWKRWTLDGFLGQDVYGSTLGIYGMGRIGAAIARRGALGFGMSVIYHNRKPADAALFSGFTAQYVTKNQLFQQADHIVVVVPYSASTHHCVAAAELALMQPHASIVNIGRGGLLDENALCDALESGQIGSAGLDVFEGEPQINPRLYAQQALVMTPHIGSASRKTRMAMAQLAADNLFHFFRHGAPLTPISV